MEEWKKYKLGDISTMKYGKLPPSSEGYKYPIWSGYRYVGMADTFNCSKGTLVVVARGVGGTGDVKVAKEDCFLTNLSISVVVDTQICNPYYLHYKYLIKNLRYLDSGSAQSQITIDALKNLSIEIPSLVYQNKVVAFLKSLDDKIEINKRINDNFYYAFFEVMLIWLLTSLENDNLEQQAQAMFKSWFVDFEPFKNGEFVNSEQGMIPKGWKAGSLEDITAQKAEKVCDRVDMKVLSPVTTGQLMLSEEYFTKQVFSESITKYKVVEIGDFAYNPARVNIGSLGRNNYNFDGCVSPVYVVFSCKDGYAYLFDLYRKTEKFKTEVNLRAIGGVRQSLNYKDFTFIQCIIPPLHVVENFNVIYEHFIDMQKHTYEESERLVSLRDTLLPRLMSGELNLNVTNL